MTKDEAILCLECMAIDMTGGMAGLSETSPMTDLLARRIEAINLAQNALRAQKETENLWHNAKTDPPKNPGLYYGRKDNTNSMWLCRYRDGVWVLDMYPEQEMPIVQWAEYTSFSSGQQPKVEAEKNEPLTLDELRQMDGEPVWCQDKQRPALSCWGVVYVNWADGYVNGFANDYVLHDLGVRWLAYRHKPNM